ncbi:MAG: hypothetical protein A3F73_12680 [Gallionellales bacterium RIFCSPLOWO2_12_FULL_59_22]|nr:MAG: hypothetical protein A3F73_12680 [Gallionellales bacterium RIFCSPLOWO2_12_FULL_59_22]
MIKDNIPVSVLIVDDNPAKLTALAAALAGMDLEITTAASGMEALRQLLAQDFAVVLLDVNMPIMDGFETAKTIRHRKKSEHLPIIFITAERFADDALLEGYGLGAVDYIFSPVLPQILRAKVAVFADLHRLREQAARQNLMLEEQVEERTAALRESETKYRLLIENLQEGIWMIDKDANTSFVNLRMAQMLGYSVEEMQGKPLFSFMDERGKEISTQNLERRKQGIREQHDFELLRKDGSRIYTSMATSSILDETGNYAGTLAGVTDITERKRAEQEQKDLSVRLQHILASTPAVHYACRIDGEHFVPTYVSPNLKDFWGYEPEEYFGNAEWWWSAIHPEGRDSVVGTFHAAIKAADRSHYAHEYRFRHKDGTYRWVHDELRIIRDEAGQPQEIVGSWLDISERKLTENNLREAKHELQEFFDLVPDMVCIASASDGCFQQVNKIWETVLGFSTDELIGKPFIDFIHPDDVAPTLAEVEKQLAGQQIANFVNRYRCKDGSYKWLEWVAKPARKDKLLYAAARDITERKRTEAALNKHQLLLRELEAQNLTSREAELKHIAREVHDELGQILTALRLDVTLINLRFGEQSAPLLAKTQGMIALLDQAARCVHDIVSNLRPAVLDIGLVPAIGWLCNEHAARTGSSCVLHTIEEHVGLDEARAVAIFRIVQELLTNAARHAEASSVTITLTRHAGDLHVVVRDNGKGFDPAAVATKKSFGLLGIRERAIALGGEVDLVSAPNQGTVVTLIVPAKPNGDNK